MSIPEDWKRELIPPRHNPNARMRASMEIPAADVPRPKNTKLTIEDVMRIRYGEYTTIRQLAQELGVSQRCVYEVLNYVTFRDLP
jgi:hypothetical protein